MMTFKVNGRGDTIAVDPTELMFAEGLELERQTGLGASKYLLELNEGTTRSTAAMFWIGAVKHRAAAAGLSFRDAALELTYEQFTDTLDVGATYASVKPVKAPEADPTLPAPDGSPEPTSRGTSAPRSRRASTKSASAT